MKKRLTYFLLFVFHLAFCQTKDTLVFKNGVKKAIKITSIDDKINYTDSTGKEQHISKDKVNYIHYSTGEKYTVSKEYELSPDATNAGNKGAHNPETLAAHKKLFSIYNEPMLNWFCESENIGVEVPLSKRITLGLNYAISHPQTYLYVNPISPAQANWPGTVYSGYGGSLNLKLFDKNKPARYTAFQLIAKSLWYRNVTFYDQPRQYGDNGVSYMRDEDETVFGLDIVRGYEYAILNNAILLDWYFGLGFRNKLRHIDTWNISSEVVASADNIANGYSFQNNFMPTPLLGVRIGFNFYKRPEKKIPLTIGAPQPSDDTIYVQTVKAEQQFQDSLTSYRKGFRLYTDLIQTLVNEFNMGLEYSWNPKFTIGVNGGIAQHFGWQYTIDANFLYNNSLRITSGYTSRAFLKYYTKKNSHSYWSIQLVYKSLWFHTYEIYPYYAFEEQPMYAMVFGQDIIHGHEFWSSNKRFFLNIYYGIGFREEYGTIYYTGSYSYLSRNTHDFYPTPIVDVNVGYRIFK
jgi:hypothetical protein